MSKKVLDLSVFDGLDRRFNDILGKGVKIGILQEHGASDAVKDPDGGSEDFTKASLATVLEYGTADGRIPGRYAFTRTFEDDRVFSDFVKHSQKLSNLYLSGNLRSDQVVARIGLFGVSAIKRKILSGEITPDNAESTKEAKRKKPGQSTKVLIDTAVNYLNAINYGEA